MSEQESRLVIKLDAKDTERQALEAAKAVEVLERAGISAETSTDKLGKQSKSTAKDITKVDKASDKTGKSVKKLSGHMDTLAGVAAGIGFTAMIKGSLDTATQIDILSERLDVSVEQLSRNAYAANTVGIETDKLADIYKDVNDRIGDFVQTGAGPMADFFENIAPKVGVTADEFQRLNGADGLQLYVDSLEKAGVSQKDMTFYMEAISGEASAMLPLLRDNGAAMARLGVEAEEVGAVLDKEFTSQARMADQEFKRLQGSVGGLTNQVTIALTPALIEGAELFRENLGLISSVTAGVGGLYVALKTATAAQAAFNAVAGLNPYVAIATAAGIATAATYAYITSTDRAVNATVRLWESASDSSAAYEVAQNRMNESQAVYDELVRDQMELQAELNQLREDGFKRYGRDANRARELEEEIAKIEEKRLKLQDARIAADKAETQRIEAKRKEQEAWQKQTDKIRNAGILDPEEAEAAAKAFDKRLDRAKSMFDALRDAFDPVGTAMDQFDQRVNSLNLLLDNGTIGITAYTQGLEEARKQYDAAARAADPYLSRVDELNKKYVDQNELLQALQDKRDAATLSGPNAGIIQSGAGQAVQDAIYQGRPDVQGIDPQIGGAFGEANRLGQEQSEVTAWYDQRIAQLKHFEATKSEIAAEAAAERQALEKERGEAIISLERQQQVARLQGTADMFGNLATMSATFAGDSAGITRGLLAFQQVAAITKAGINTFEAISNASVSAPFPANLAAMAAVGAQVAGLASQIASFAMPSAPTFTASNYAGAYDKGGYIPADAWGIMSERGTELYNGVPVPGPAKITSREDTAKMMQGGATTYHISINVEAPAGSNEEDLTAFAQRLERTLPAKIDQRLAHQMRDGGMLKR